MKFNLIFPEQDVMQYFIQWQRYRKYWWSSITTTPSLFGIGDIRYGEGTADVNIVAKFAGGQFDVEKVTIKPSDSVVSKSACLTCTISLEGTLFILLLDGLANTTKEKYLRLHRKMAPYKFSFASEASQNESLSELAKLLYYRLESKRISSLLPDFSLPLESQIQTNLQMGVEYTAILTENTLTNGIFNLMNSSTMLKEQIHVADFDSYAALICGK